MGFFAFVYLLSFGFVVGELMHEIYMTRIGAKQLTNGLCIAWAVAAFIPLFNTLVMLRHPFFWLLEQKWFEKVMFKDKE